MRALIVHCATIAVLAGSVPNIVWAGSTGRRNTAIATTAVAVGAWSNGTGSAGRRNTAILATGAAAVAWGRYADKKKSSKRAPRRVVIAQSRPVPVVHRQVVYACTGHKHKHGCSHSKHKGRALGHLKHHHKH